MSCIEAVSDAGERLERIVVPRCGKSAEIWIGSRFRRREFGDDMFGHLADERVGYKVCLRGEEPVACAAVQ